MATGEIRDGAVSKPTRHPKKSDSLAHLSGCSSVALWLVVASVGTYILYGFLVWLTINLADHDSKLTPDAESSRDAQKSVIFSRGGL